jgi:kynurenine---oxoglutarate transaminase / cysteine-S-conjugate beta-lyase / glutamine---phenylpyruvate transaminase
MWERTITVSSCGKTFSATGWKVGWCYGHKDLVKPVVLANQWVQYCVSSPTQKAIATILDEADKPYNGHSTYYEYVKHEYERKRDFLVKALTKAHLKPVIPEGGFFIIADTSAHEFPEKYSLIPGPAGEVPVTRDWAFAR